MLIHWRPREFPWLARTELRRDTSSTGYLSYEPQYVVYGQRGSDSFLQSPLSTGSSRDCNNSTNLS